MTTVYFIRHAQAEGNLHHQVQGTAEREVTALGREQIAALRKRFADMSLDAVYSSDLRRAVETAEAVSEPEKLPIRIERAFREIDFGDWEGREMSEIARNDADQFDAFLHHMDLWQVPGGETPQQVLNRFLPALDRVLKENEGKTVAIVSHGCALRIVLAYLRGLSLKEAGDFVPCVNTAVSKVTWEGDVPMVVYQDDGSHWSEQKQSADWWRG